MHPYLLLQALYRIVLVESPLPVERFLTNFCTEVPVPPPGVVQVRFGFVSALARELLPSCVSNLISKSLTFYISPADHESCLAN